MKKSELRQIIREEIVKELSKSKPKIIIGRGGVEQFSVDDIFPNSVIDPTDEDYNSLMELWDESGLSVRELPKQTIKIKQIYPHQDLVIAKKVKDIMQKGASEGDMNDVFIATLDNKKYYLVDGHTRVAAQILSGKTSIKARVYDPLQM